MPELRLAGCGSRSLLGYLKALGVLRIVSGQAARTARARWREGVFELRVELDEAALTAFLLHEHAPAPVVSPWNGGSGFHPKDEKEAILALEATDDPRFAGYRATIIAARAGLAARGILDKPESSQKPALVRELRRSLPDEALPWLDAAIIVTGDSVAFPPLLGSGGNDGRYDFSNNYAQAVVQCLLHAQPERSKASLSAALHGTSVELEPKLSLGHLSRDVSPTNSPRGQSDSLGNPWDLILAVEGTLLLVAGAARRHGAGTRGSLVAPFTAHSTAAGYSSAAGGEAGRDELWLPLWSGWASGSEISTLVRESRAQVRSGRSHRSARTGLDFARAAGELGVARGIDAFERYAILERAGQSNLAVPAGRISVVAQPKAEALRSIDPWLGRLLRFGGEDRCPRALAAAIRRLENATFQLASRGSATHARVVLEAIGGAEHVLARSRSAIDAGLRPMFGAPAAPWIAAANDGSPEFALAVSIASLRDRTRRSPGLRDYLHGTRNAGGAFDEARRHAVHASGPARLLAAIHARRHLDAARSGETDDGGEGGRSLTFDFGSWGDLDAVRLFASGALDDERIVQLVRGLVLLDHGISTALPRASSDQRAALPAFDVLALAWWGTSRAEDRQRLGPRPGWAARLAAGATAHVIRDAMLRLRMAGLPVVPHAEDILAGNSSGPRLAAALLVPLGPRHVESLARKLVVREDHHPNHQMEESA